MCPSVCADRPFCPPQLCPRWCSMHRPTAQPLQRQVPPPLRIRLTSEPNPLPPTTYRKRSGIKVEEQIALQPPGHSLLFPALKTISRSQQLPPPFRALQTTFSPQTAPFLHPLSPYKQTQRTPSRLQTKLQVLLLFHCADARGPTRLRWQAWLGRPSRPHGSPTHDGRT